MSTQATLRASQTRASRDTDNARDVKDTPRTHEHRHRAHHESPRMPNALQQKSLFKLSTIPYCKWLSTPFWLLLSILKSCTSRHDNYSLDKIRYHRLALVRHLWSRITQSIAQLPSQSNDHSLITTQSDLACVSKSFFSL